ncbi:nucleotide pyrophosphohydrolase, partial [Francisella tularensis subsp. holarctica]|nr:nucleotide pyrophosphohydrolase [Francisella tularensis subsp. holarctica]
EPRVQKWNKAKALIKAKRTKLD